MTYSETVSEHSMPSREGILYTSGISWGAVIGGAFVTAAFSLILFALGAGFGLSSVSPWSGVGVSASTAGNIAIAWLVVTQLVACALGGYLTGRLRTRWIVFHADEVHFRDTANGLLAWAVAVVITAAFLGSAATSMAGNAGSSDRTSKEMTSTAYFVDLLLRSERPATGNDAEIRGEAERILTLAVLNSDTATADREYLVQMVAARTGLNNVDASKRVSDTLNNARVAADTARSAAARLLLWVFVALLLGAFSASLAATIGGFQRDHVQLA
ncbi:MAG: hypothetical protein ABIR70_21490 [Bryobacteraceae bacterium]